MSAGVGVDRLCADTLLARMDEQERAALSELGSERFYPGGAVLMFEDELEERVSVLLEGRVKLTRRGGRDRRETLLHIRDSGDVLGELSLIDRQPRAVTVTALEPVRALVMPAAALRAHLESSPRVAVVLLEILAKRWREEVLGRLQLTASDTMGRVAARILELDERYGEPNGSGSVVLMPISQEELASWAGASRAGAAHAMQAMRELGWIATERRRLLVLDAQALRARAS